MERKVAFVTGASRGIGKAAAIGLAEAGYDVVVTARTVEEGEKYDYGPSVAGSGTLAMPGSIRKTAEEIRLRGRRALPIRLDLMDRFVDLTDEAVKQVFEGNVFAQIHLTQKILPAMLQRGQGIIINMTSNAGLNDPPGPVGEGGGWGFAYGASKGAFHRMAGILHVELHQRGICAYNVQPGLVVTESHRVLMGEDSDIVRVHRGSPVEVPAAVITWLATNPEAVAMSGQTLYAQRFCKDRQLVPGWPPAAK